MWGSTTSPPHWRHSVEGSATIGCEESHIKGSSEESLLLQGPIGLGSGEEDVLQTEKAESEGEAEYSEGTVLPVSAETATDGNNNCESGTSTNCFSLVRAVKPERKLALSAGGQHEGLLACHDSSSTAHGLAEGSRVAVDSLTPPQKVKIASTVISEVFLGTNSHNPVLPGGAAVASSALPGAVGHRFSGLGGSTFLPSALSLAGSGGALNSWHQHPKQQQQQTMYLRPHIMPTGGARSSGNIPVILTALRRHLRSLISIVYNKQHGKTHANSSLMQEETNFQKEQDNLLYCRETGGGCGVSVSINEEHTSAACCIKGLSNESQTEYPQCSAGVEMHEIPPTYKSSAQDEPLMGAPKQADGLRIHSTVSSQLRPPSPQEGPTEPQEGSSEAAGVSATGRRGTAAMQLPNSSRDSALLHLGSVDGAAESWEGQRYFHEEHLDGCSLSELSEYLQIFSSFLSLSLPEVSRQEPGTLQHVRLQLLLLRNNHQQQPSRLRQAKQILQRWPPLVYSSAVGGSDANDDGTSLNSCAEATISPVDVCLRNNTASGAPRPSMPFSSANLTFFSSFSSSPSSHVEMDASSVSASAIPGEKGANGSAVTTEECETAAEPAGIRSAEFPSSSVEAFSVDGPPSSSNNAGALGTPTAVVDCPVPPAVPTTFLDSPANESPGGASGISACKEKLPMPWSSDSGGTAGTAAAPASGLRWSPLSGTAIGIRLHSLMGGASLGLGNTLSLSGSSGGGTIQQTTETPSGTPPSANGCCGVGALLEGGAATLALSPGSLEWIRDGTTNTAGSRRQCSSKRSSDRGGKGKGGETREDATRCGSRGSKDTSRKAGSAVTPIPQVTIGLAGPPGGAFNLAKSNNQEFILPKSDFSASRVARLSRRAMELPYVHGVRFEAANFAWVAQMRGEARRFLVKKHGFVKSRLCAIEKIEMWRAALSPEALASELKAEQDVLAMVPTMCPEEADPEAMQAVEESLRLKFQRGSIISCRPAGGPSIGLKRQRNLCLDTERDICRANRPHDTFPEHLLAHQQQVMAAQHLNLQPNTQPDGQRHQFQLAQPQFVQASQQQLLESPQQHLLAQEHLLRAMASPVSNADPPAGRDVSEQPQQQHVLLSLQEFRTRGQQQHQLMPHQFQSPLPALPGMRLQHQTIGPNSQPTRATGEQPQ
ncbi:hypothetical protein, conserved [Eimeria praecox]|uniref:Uncharacterized protein n=1 Tax=Eimeria praecox TaxID=51316 RepID=U6G796_9EIME|nr:hypothetical protein, conserved [Eimeria praecox]